MLTHYLKITFRTIRKEKFRYIITTLGISVGIVIFSTMLLIVDGVKNNASKVPNYDKLYKFRMATQTSNEEVIIERDILNMSLNEAKKISVPDIDKIGIIDEMNESLFISNLDDGNKIFQATKNNANSDFFDLIGVKFIEGGASKDTKAKDQIVITEKYANLLFGTTKAIGNKTSVYNYKNEFIGTYTVVGVIKEYKGLDYIFDFIILNSFEEYTDIRVETLVSLNKHFDIERANATLKPYKIGTHCIGDEDYDCYAKLIPYTDGAAKIPIVIIIGLLLMGGMTLAISLFNFVNLLISSMQARVRQFSLRKIVGAQQWTFITMIILEVLPVIIVSVLLSYFLLEMLVYILTAYNIGEPYTRLVKLIFTYPLKIGFWMFVGSVILSFIMSKRLQKIVLTKSMRGEVFSIRKNRGRNILLFVELMLTLIFINTSMFLLTTGLNNIPKQYQPLPKVQSKAILNVPLDKLNLISDREEITNRIKSVSGVTLVIDGFYLGNRSWGGTGDRVSATEMFEYYADFWELDDPIYKRELAPTEAIVNKKYADKLQKDNSNSFNLGDELYNVVGVVDDIPLLERGSNGALLGKDPSSNISNSIFVKCNPKSKDRVQKDIMKIIRDFLPPTIDYKITSINNLINIQISVSKTYATIMLIASLFSIIITVLGIYTSITYDTNRKRKEIAIRKINGASRKNILMFISKEYVIIILVAGTLSALLHRFLITKIFQSLGTINTKYNILFDIAILLLMTLIIAAIVSLKIRKAMSENPSEVIKSE